MGTTESSSQKLSEFQSNWHQIGPQIHGGKIWANNQNHLLQRQIHQICANDHNDYQQDKSLYYIRENHPYLVASIDFIDRSNRNLCSTSYLGDIHLQRIPLRLTNLEDIPFPSSLHLYHTSIEGFNSLFDRYGPFRVNSDHIGINNSRIVKVWMNANYSSSYPSSRLNSQKQMLSFLIKILQSHIDTSTHPQPILHHDIGSFDAVRLVMKKYIQKHNKGIIPTHLECIDEMGGMDKLVKYCQTGITGSRVYVPQNYRKGQYKINKDYNYLPQYELNKKQDNKKQQIYNNQINSPKNNNNTQKTQINKNQQQLNIIKYKINQNHYQHFNNKIPIQNYQSLIFTNQSTNNQIKQQITYPQPKIQQQTIRTSYSPLPVAFTTQKQPINTIIRSSSHKDLHTITNPRQSNVVRVDNIPRSIGNYQSATYQPFRHLADFQRSPNMQTNNQQVARIPQTKSQLWHSPNLIRPSLPIVYSPKQPPIAQVLQSSKQRYNGEQGNSGQLYSQQVVQLRQIQRQKTQNPHEIYYKTAKPTLIDQNGMNTAFFRKSESLDRGYKNLYSQNKNNTVINQGYFPIDNQSSSLRGNEVKLVEKRYINEYAK